MLVTLSGIVTLVRSHAAKEGTILNSGDAIGDRHARQTTAFREGTPANAGNAVGDRHARQTNAPSESVHPQFW